MAESTVDLPVSVGGGDKLRAETVTTSEGQVKQEVVTLADALGLLIDFETLSQEASQQIALSYLSSMVGALVPTLDVALSTRASQTTVASILATLSAGISASAPPRHVELDYTGRTDSQPVYLGKATPGTATPVATWTVTKFRYETSADNARCVEFDVRTPIKWDNRTDPTLDGQPAWTF